MATGTSAAPKSAKNLIFPSFIVNNAKKRCSGFAPFLRDLSEWRFLGEIVGKPLFLKRFQPFFT